MCNRTASSCRSEAVILGLNRRRVYVSRNEVSEILGYSLVVNLFRSLRKLTASYKPRAGHGFRRPLPGFLHRLPEFGWAIGLWVFFLKTGKNKKRKRRPFPNSNPPSPVKRRGDDMGRANFVLIRTEYIAKRTTNLTTAKNTIIMDHSMPLGHLREGEN